MAALVANAALAEEIAIERVFGPEVPTGKYKHPASINQLANGDLYLVYYGGEGEYEGDTAVYGSRLAVGSKQWTPPVKVADTPHRSEGNGVIWQAPDGKVWLFYVVRYGDTWSTSRIQAKISSDGAQTWSDPMVVAWEEGTMVRSHPIVLADGDYLLPVYHETGHDTEKVGSDTASLFLRYSPKDHTWTPTNKIHSRIGNLQPSVVQLTPEHLIAYCRRGGDYEPTTRGWIVRSESRDGGRTWSPGVETKFPNPNAACDFIKLQNGHLLLVYNNSQVDRTPLTVAISTDNDQSYPYQRDIATGDFDYAYPSAIQTQDGKIHIVYTSHARTVINHAVFDESAITGKK
ncbi:MAG: exo-alpha-sialidase [Planctomycetaceae bacterium]|nr:exo-alpha-sialidase [Planctomycetaceae bacterium]